MHGFALKVYFLVGLALLGFHSSAQDLSPGRSLTTPLGDLQVPYIPILTESQNPGHCELLLADAVRVFGMDTYRLDLAGESALTQPLAQTITPEQFMALGNDVPVGSVAIYSSDSATLYAIHATSESGPLYLGLYHRRTTGSFIADTLVTFPSLGDLQYAIVAAQNRNGYFGPPAGARSLLNSEERNEAWFNNRILSMFEGTLYVLRGTGSYYTTGQTVSLLALEAFRQLRPVCALQWRPMETSSSSSTPNAMPSVSLLREALMMAWAGTTQPQCAAYMLCTPSIDDVRMTMLQRPWASTRRGSSPQLNYNTVSRMDAGLAERALYSNVAREENRQIQKLRPQVKEELAAYYQSVFGLERQLAMQLAADWADFFYTAGFSFTPEGYEWQSRRWNMDRPYEDPQVSLARRQFRELLNAEAPLDQFAELIQNLKQSAPQDTFKDMLPLADVVHMPELLALMLQEAEEVEDFNRFYKSALMNAAHRNSLESVRLLVEAGAQVNARTMVGQGNTMIGNRVALHYALENASEELVAFLLENGADTLAIDSRNRSVQEYLKLSKRPEEEKERIRQMLAQYPQFWWDTVP